MPHVVALLVLVASTASAASRLPISPCDFGQFLIPDGRHVVADVTAPATESIVVDAAMAAIMPACPRAPVKFASTRRSWIFRARWASCGTSGKVKLRAVVSKRHCDRLRGTVVVGRGKHSHRKLRATRAPYEYDVALDPTSPWPKFRRTSRQDGRSPVHVATTGGNLWTFPTGKGIFSTPVIDGDGTVYVGSADRTFYAIARDGTLKWSRLTGEIIDSSALLDDRGRVYIGSGDGHVYALDAATGAEVWRFAAQPAADTGGYINWFEGNVAMGVDGNLYAPNDNFRVYVIDRDDGTSPWAVELADQTWSSPAVDVATGHF